MLAQSLQPGMRVRARVATVFVAQGVQGCVLGAWPNIPHAYDVHFDGQREAQLMWEDELELADSATAPNRERAVGQNAETS